MNIGKLIYAVVASDATLVGLVGTRVYPEEAPNTVTYPYITFSKVNTQPTRVKNIVSPLDMVKVTFFVYSKNYDTSENVAIALRNKFDNLRGTYNSVNLDWCIFEYETTGDPVMEDKIYWIAIDFLFKINRL
jgi:hypothetical protein